MRRRSAAIWVALALSVAVHGMLSGVAARLHVGTEVRVAEPPREQEATREAAKQETIMPLMLMGEKTGQGEAVNASPGEVAASGREADQEQASLRRQPTAEALPEAPAEAAQAIPPMAA